MSTLGVYSMFEYWRWRFSRIFRKIKSLRIILRERIRVNKCVTGITFAMTLPVEENVPWKQGLLTTETMQKIDQVCIQYFICTVKKFVLECNEL